ncbi:hypothetical protein CK203_028665 [Vitis vinifera]|uniref:Uncharacterized protein n=1 Tax=Vitis vinifera TaxID=29760 RepID=A0A438IFH4_VITVI|nr:hypothetical protein CK203_028665 [Vitis vinifera]
MASTRRYAMRHKIGRRDQGMKVMLFRSEVPIKGATDHMTSSSKPSSSYSPWAGNQKVKIVDGSLLATAEKSKLTQDQKCQANFFPSQYEFQDLNSRRMTDSARQSGDSTSSKMGPN